jgi:hypothetical protein
MKASIILMPVAAALASAATVSINATTSGINNPNGGWQEITNVPLSGLSYSNLHVTALEIIDGSGVGIDAASVECRMYKDNLGLEPGSLPFRVDVKAYIATNTVSIGSLLCYAI